MKDFRIGAGLTLAGLACLVGGFWLGTWGSVAGFIGGAFFTVGAAFLHCRKPAQG